MSCELLRFVLVSLFLQLDPIPPAVFILHVIPAVAPLVMLQLSLCGEHAEDFTLIGTQLQSGSVIFASVLELTLRHRSGSGHYVCKHITVDLFWP